MAGHWVTWSPRESPRPDSYQVSFSLSLFFFFFLFFSFFPSFLFYFSFAAQRLADFTRRDAAPLAARLLPRPRPASHVAQVEVSLLYPPVGRDLLRLMALHVLLHGGQAGAVLGADGALVGRGAVVRAQVLDHGRVVPGALVAQLALEGLLAWGGRAGENQCGGGAVKASPGVQGVSRGDPHACWGRRSL